MPWTCDLRKPFGVFEVLALKTRGPAPEVPLGSGKAYRCRSPKTGMKDKKPTSKRELLLFLLDSVNYEDEYNWVKAELDQMDAQEASCEGRRA